MLRRLLDAVPAAIYTTDEAGRVTFFNEAAAELWGRRPELGKDLWCGSWRIYYPDGSPMPLDTCPMAVTLREGRPVRGEVIVVERPDGTRRVVEPHPEPLRDGSGKLVGGVNLLVDISDFQRTQEALRRSESRTRAIVEAEPECVKVVAPDGTLLEMNPAGLAMVGARSAAEVVGSCVFNLVEAESLAAFRSLHEGALAGRTSTAEFRIVGLKGERRWMESTATPLRDSSDAVYAVLSVTRDITSRKTIENELLERSQALETINRVGVKLVAELDLQKLLGAITDAGRELAGAEFGAFFYNTTDDRGERYTLYTISGVPREAFSKFPMPRNTAVFGPTFRGEGVVRSGDITRDPRYGKNSPHHGMPEGHLPVRSYLAVPVKSRSGEVLGGLFYGHSGTDVFTERAETVLVAIAAQAGVALDNARLFSALQRELEERRRAEADVRRSESLFRHLADSMPQIVWAARPDGTVDYFNKRWYELTAGEPGTCGDESWLPVLHPEDRGPCLEAWRRCVRTGEPYQMEYRFRFPRSDEYRWYLGRALPVRDEAGVIVRWFGTSTDIHDLKLAEAQLAHHNEALNRAVEQARAELEASSERLRLSERMASLGTMAAGLGHDVGNLLVPLRAHLDELRSRRGDPLDAENLAGIERCADYFASLAQGLRAFGHGAAADNLGESTDAAAWCRKSVPFLKNMGGSGVRLEIDAEDGECRAAIGPGALTQVVGNLVKNAADAIGPDRTGVVRVRIRRADGGVSLTVADNGPGMSEEVRRRCMEPYFTTRVRGHTTGTGLGLAIVHQAIVAAGGRIEIDSAAGGGTAVRLWLPGAKEESVGSRRAWVRIADPHALALVKSMLSAARYEVEQDPRPPESADLWVTDHLEATEEAPPRLIIVGEPNGRTIPEARYVPPRPTPGQIVEAIREVG